MLLCQGTLHSVLFSKNGLGFAINPATFGGAFQTGFMPGMSELMPAEMSGAAVQ